MSTQRVRGRLTRYRLNSPRHLLGIVAGLRNLLTDHLLLNALDLDTFAFDIQTEPPEQAHVLVGYPNERETGDEVSAPIDIKQLIPGDDEKEDRHVMAETVFAREQIKKLTPREDLHGRHRPNGFVS